MLLSFFRYKSVHIEATDEPGKELKNPIDLKNMGSKMTIYPQVFPIKNTCTLVRRAMVVVIVGKTVKKSDAGVL